MRAGRRGSPVLPALAPSLSVQVGTRTGSTFVRGHAACIPCLVGLQGVALATQQTSKLDKWKQRAERVIQPYDCRFAAQENQGPIHGGTRADALREHRCGQQ